MSIAEQIQTVPTGAWTSDPKHSSVQFSVLHNGLTPFRGGFDEFEATLTDGRLVGIAKVESITTEDANLTGHLLSPEFFDAERNPELRFESKEIRTDGNRVNKSTFGIRGDHYFNSQNRLFARYSFDDTPFIRAAPYGRDNPASPGTGPQTFNRKNAVIEDDHTFSASLLATFRYSLTRLTNYRSAFSQGFDITTLGFPAALASPALH